MENNMTLLDYAPYITGAAHFPGPKQAQSVDFSMIVQFAERVKSDTVAEQLFDMCEKYTDFFDMHVDAKTWVPKEHRQEVFYAVKNGEFTTFVPSVCSYVLKKAWKECFGIPNLIIKVLPKNYLQQFCSEGFISPEYTLRDVICNLCTPEYEPLSEHKRKIRHAEYSEIYIADTDMVAAIPNRIADEITDSMIDVIKVGPEGLCYGESLIRTMGGSYGITNSVYDLRELV